jgi:hypothetical protein
MIEEKTMGITTTLKKTYPRKGGEPPKYHVIPGGDVRSRPNDSRRGLYSYSQGLGCRTF